MTYFFSIEICFARNELPTALEGVGTVSKCEVDNILPTVRMIEMSSAESYEAAETYLTRHVEEVN
jgi:hypothetical protein